MMCIRRVVLLMALLLGSRMVLADCSYNGATYPAGTVLGPYVCDGTQWVLKQ